MAEETWVGKSVHRVDGQAKVQGALVYSSDVYTEGMLHCRPVLAPHPHARIKAIHMEEALAVPGVVRVLTAADVPGKNEYSFLNDREVLCEKTRYIGDMIAVVVAETEYAARMGAEKVTSDFEPLTIITDPERVIQGGYDVQVQDTGDISKEIHYARGDIDATFEGEGMVVLEQDYTLQMMDHAFLETEAAAAFPENGGVRIISGAQSACYNQFQVAEALGLPIEKVVTVEPQTGGAFGGKANLTVHIVTALAAILTGKPCRMVWTRKERFLAGIKRHPLKIWLKSAATREGKLAGLQAKIVIDTGAYNELGLVLMDTAVENITGPYKIPNVKIDSWLVYTNNAAAGAFRGLGAPEACMAIESHMSQVAELLQMDPIEFRQRNLAKQGDLHGAGHTLLAPLGTAAALNRAAEHAIWRDKAGAKTSPGSTIKRGLGVGMGMKGYSFGIGDSPDYGTAIMELTPNGRLLLKVGVLEGGQGSLTVLTQIAAEAFGCPMDWVDMIAADTSQVLDGGMTAASRMTYTAGRALMRAAEELKVHIFEIAAEDSGLPAGQFRIKNGVVVGPSGKTLPLNYIAEAASKTLRAEVKDRVPYSERPAAGALGSPHVLYSSVTQVVQVAVDTETGKVEVEKVVCFADVGKAINPQGVEGQCEGGIVQGLGYALMEETFVENGVMLNPDLSTYIIPTACDVPDIETVLIEEPEDTGPYGAKGIGENATVPTAPAILNAIADAIGVRFTAMPVTPEKVLEALAAKNRDIQVLL